MARKFAECTVEQAQAIFAQYHVHQWQAVYIHNNHDDQGMNILIEYDDSRDSAGCRRTSDRVFFPPVGTGRTTDGKPRRVVA